MRVSGSVRVVAATLLLLALASCSKPPEPVKIIAIDLGSAVDDENRVLSPAMTYSAQSTVYASIATEGMGTATLTARWTDPDGQLLADQTQAINPTKPAYFEFHLAPPGGWGKGRHKVVFAIGGTGSRTREFEIR